MTPGGPPAASAAYDGEKVSSAEGEMVEGDVFPTFDARIVDLIERHLVLSW